jgi:alpha-tubulin suppressor-like RCC1 family protein
MVWFQKFPHFSYWSSYKPEATAQSVKAAGAILKSTKQPAFSYLENVPSFKNVKANKNGFVALSDKAKLWSFGNNEKMELGSEF